jgi:hypothetical protein
MKNSDIYICALCALIETTDIYICALIETKMNETIDIINQTHSVLEADPLYSN